MMAAAPADAHYFGLDLFQFGTPELDRKEFNVKQRVPVAQVEQLLNEHKIQHHLFHGRSKNTLPLLADTYGENIMDLIFIDGGHSVETIKNDWKWSRRLIRDGGVIVLDDYYSSMPLHRLGKVGCNRVIQDIDHIVLPAKDMVAGGGIVQMVRVNC